MAKQSSQKFIARNRAPRVQIEYDVETNNGQQKVEIPFVMGVMADLSGKSASELPSVNERKLLEIDGDNFDRRLCGPEHAHRRGQPAGRHHVREHG
jgi:type VI secretion system protein ImpB